MPIEVSLHELEAAKMRATYAAIGEKIKAAQKDFAKAAMRDKQWRKSRAGKSHRKTGKNDKVSDEAGRKGEHVKRA